MSKQLYKCFSIAGSETLLSCFCFVVEPRVELRVELINFTAVIFCKAKHRCVMYRVCSHECGYKCCCQRIKDARIAILLNSFIMRSNAKPYFEFMIFGGKNAISLLNCQSGKINGKCTNKCLFSQQRNVKCLLFIWSKLNECHSN